MSIYQSLWHRQASIGALRRAVGRPPFPRTWMAKVFAAVGFAAVLGFTGADARELIPLAKSVTARTWRAVAAKPKPLVTITEKRFACVSTQATIAPCNPSMTVNASSSGNTKVFTLTYTGSTAKDFPLGCTVGTLVTSCSVSPTSLSFFGAGSQDFTLTFAVGSTTGSGAVTAKATPSPSSVVQLTVQAPPPVPDHIVVSPHTWRGAPNASTTLSATVYDINNNVLSGQSVSWISRNTGVATVGASGTSTTVTAGQTIGSTYVVASTSNGKTDSTQLTSTLASVTLAASPGTLTLGQGSLVQATVRNQWGTIIDDVPLTWISSDGSLASVTGSTELGFVSGSHTGTVTITAQTSDGFSGQVPVIYQAAPVVNAGGSNTAVIYPATKKVIGNSQQTLTITWCAFPPNIVNPSLRSIRANGVEVKDQFDLVQNPAACGFSGPVGDEILYTSTGTITVDETTGPVTVQADMTNGAGYYITTSTEVYSPGPKRHGVTVVAEQQFLSVPASSARSERFTIKNAGEVTDTVTLSTTGCSSGAIATACSLSPSGSVIVAAGSSAVVTANYTASSSVGSAGLVTLKAANLSGTAIDSSWTDVTVAATPSAGVTIAGLAPGANDVLPRGACVTIALTSDAASECGDLRLVHDLPSVRTMGTVRTPTLLYNSQHARPKPIVLADVTLSSGASLPPTVTACIKVAGVSRGCTAAFAGSSWGSPGNTRRVAILGDDGTWNTGPVDFTVEVTASNGNQGPYTATGRLFIVNRSASAFGAGWWLAGLEKLIVVSGTELVWIGGDGSARRYVKAGSVWRAPNFAGLDSIISAGSGYARVTPQHARVYFSSTGQHDSTVNVLGHVTRFEYTSGLLTKIRVPKPNGAFFDYTFAYTSGLLDSVQAADGRATKLFRTSARVDSIRDPDGMRVRFSSGSGNNQYVVIARTDRRGNSTSFAYDAGNRLSQASRPLSNTTVLGAAETQGLSTPVLLDSAFTQIDGPRSDVIDLTRFWLNAYGAPVRVRDALGRESRAFYNASWPGLADSVMSANRLATRAFYNVARGLTDSVRVYNPLGTGVNTVTKYQWHGSLNRVTSVRSPTSAGNWLVDSMSYNTDGTMQWQQRGTGASLNRVNFTYTAEKLPEKSILPAAPIGPDTSIFFYDALGNLRKQRSPTGILALSFGDGIGRDTLVITARGTGSEATDSTQLLTKGVRQRTYFDAMSRDTLAITASPSVTLSSGRVVPADTINLRSTYDEESNHHTATRSYTAKHDGTEGGLYQMGDSRWEYDALNRVYQQEDAAGGVTNFTLDPAGNATAMVTPRGHTIKVTYDALNRVSRRVVPGVTYESSFCHSPSTCTFPTFEGPTACVGVDSLFFGYDAAGNMIKADNNWAKIRRGYLPNGLLKQETQAIRTYGTPLPAACGGGDRHSLADADNYSHTYVLSYDYDLAGRRTKLYHPDALDPCNGICIQSYGYDPTTGLLDTLVHPSPSGTTLTTTFEYDNQLRVTTTNHPGAVSTSRTYDHESRLATRTGPVTNDSFTRDAVGRVIGGSVLLPATGASKTLGLEYSGMGALVRAEGSTEGVSYEEYQTDALGNRLWVRDNEMIDGVDRTKYQSYLQSTGQLTNQALGTQPCGLAGAIHRSCHPSWYSYAFNQSHDLSGNVDATWGGDTRGTDVFNAVVIPDESRNYYGAGEQLMYTNRLVGQTTPGESAGGFEEYRYDALGRRVFTRSRRPSGCSFPCEAYVERTVWDGSQVLYEIRSSGGTSVDSTYFELEGGVATGDEPNLYGLVAYAHAAGIDEPLGILKKIPGTGWAYVTPHANWKGDWSYGTFANGTLCLTMGATCPSWPGFYLSMDRGYTGATAPSYSVWWGDLIRGSTDNSGLVYQRNRYYDPKTGRFTQVDPIGLAGGLNSYGFAAGDPVNFADPFGLRGGCAGPSDIRCNKGSPSHSIVATMAAGIGGAVDKWWKAKRDATLTSVYLILSRGMAAGEGSQERIRASIEVQEEALPTRSEAFRQAKAANGVPRSATPDRQYMTRDANTGQQLRTWDFTNVDGESVTIREDAARTYPDGGKQGPHFNAGPTGDKLPQHYYYKAQ